MQSTEDKESSGSEKKEVKKFVTRSLVDVQRCKLDKLMKNIDKPMVIPELPKAKDYANAVPSFVRNVMGSSAGAGSGEFHVYRHLRRKEYARQKAMQQQGMKEKLASDFQAKLDENKRVVEEKTAKKRAKRQKKKQKMLAKKKQKKDNPQAADANEDKETSEDSSENDEPEESQTSEKDQTDGDNSNDS